VTFHKSLLAEAAAASAGLAPATGRVMGVVERTGGDSTVYAVRDDATGREVLLSSSALHRLRTK